MYQFAKLSPNEFENLSADIVGAMQNRYFQRFAEGPDGGIDGLVDKDCWILQAKRYKNTSDLLSKIKSEKPKLDKLKPKRYFLVTSCSLTPKNKTDIQNSLTPHIISTDDILALDDLDSLIKDYPKILRKYHKLWLESAEELGFILNQEFYNRGSIALEKIKENIKLFVPFENIEDINKKLEEDSFLFILGNAGSGKTFLAEYLAFYYFIDDYELHYLTDRNLNSALRLIRKGEKQVFILDDFLGANFLNSENIISVSKDLKTLLDIAKRSENNLKLIFTSRDYILSQFLNQLDDNILKSNISNGFISTDMKNPKFRANLLYNYLENFQIDESIKKEFVESEIFFDIIKHPNFNPRLLKNIFSELNEKKGDIKTFFIDRLNNPNLFFHTTFLRLSKEAQTLIYALCLAEEYICSEDLREEFNNLYSKLNNTIPSPFFFDNAVDELEPNFIISKNNAGDIWFRIENGSIRDFILKSIQKTTPLLVAIIETVEFFEFCIEVFDLHENDNRAIKTTKEQQKILIEKSIKLLENPIYDLRQNEILDKDYKEVWTKDRVKVGESITKICNRVKSDKNLLQCVAKLLEEKYRDNEQIYRQIITTGNLPTLFPLFEYFSKSLKETLYKISLESFLNSEDVKAVVIEYKKNKDFKNLFEKDKKRIIKNMEKCCEDEINRAVDEYHIQAIAEDLYIIGDIFPSFNSLKYLYQEKLDNIFNGNFEEEFYSENFNGYWNTQIIKDENDEFIKKVEFEKEYISKFFDELRY